MYIDIELRCNLIKSISVTIENLMECVTIEIDIERSKNIIISCVYRSPGTCMDTFMNKLFGVFDKWNENKVQIIYGYFNIDLLNPNGNKRISVFTGTLYSKGLFPVITKHSRITKNTAKLIDNIYIYIYIYI